MALGRSIKMYLTIFVATTCMYMVLYQYHISRQPMPQPDIIKQHRDKSVVRDNQLNGIGGSYTSYSSSSSSTSLLNNSSNNINSAATLALSSALNHSLNIKKLSAFNKTLSSPSSTSSSLTALSLFSLPKHTSKFLKKMNLFLWSPVSLLSSSSSSSKVAKRAISSKKLSLAFKKHNKTDKMSPPSSLSSLSSSAIARVMDFNNTLITSSSTTTFSAATTTTTTTSSKTPTTITTSTKSSTFPLAYDASFATKLATTIKTSVRKLSQKTKQINHHNRHYSQDNDKPVSSLQQQQQQQQRPEQEQQHKETDKPPLYIITPTYRRPEQLAELTRLGYTLKHVNNLLWLVIEDANKTSENVIEILNRIGVPYEYFLAPMPDQYKKSKGAKPRGVSNRNRGLKWLRENATEGVFYFADDDNTYDVNIFEQMRYTKKVSMWPVGLVTKFGVSSPIVKQGKLTGFYDGWIGGRKYPVDMAGFAVSVKFLHERPNAKMPFKTGYEEDGFLKSLAPLNNTEIELLANNCTEILTWHTQTKKNNPAETINATKYMDTNLILLDKMLVRH